MQNETENPAATGSFDRQFDRFESLRGVERPKTGWLRAVREAGGVSAGELGRRLGVSRQLPLQFEHAEAADTITLKSLRTVAAALDCDLVYALVPRNGAQEIQAESSKGAAKTAEKPLIAPATKSRLTPRKTTTQPSNGDSPASEVASSNPYFCD